MHVALSLFLYTAALQDPPAEPRPQQEFAPTIKVEGKIDWFGGSYADALEEARKTGRLVLLHFWAHW